MNAQTFCELALALPEVTSAPHFDRKAFRTPRRIFATLAADGLSVNLMLQPDQQALVVRNSKAFAPLPNKWGDQGATCCVLARVTVAVLTPALAAAHANAAPTPRPKRRR
jgi:hypothetical protein